IRCNLEAIDGVQPRLELDATLSVVERTESLKRYEEDLDATRRRRAEEGSRRVPRIPHCRRETALVRAFPKLKFHLSPGYPVQQLLGDRHEARVGPAEDLQERFRVRCNRLRH